MASKKTESTEISLAVGILGIHDPNKISEGELEHLFEGSLSKEKFYDYIESFNGQYKSICREMIDVGLQVRKNHPHIKTFSTLKWTGPQNICITTALSKDLQVGPIAVSAKAKSDVVANHSPYNLLVAYPSGIAPQTRSPNWFLVIAKDEFQSYYSKIRALCFPGQSQKVEEFFNTTNQDYRKLLVNKAKLLDDNQKRELNELYLLMCHSVAIKSASKFNDAYKKSVHSSQSQAVRILLAKVFFRIDSSPYVLAGLDRREKITLAFPDTNSWHVGWDILDVIAQPDLTAGQSIVRFIVKIRDKNNKNIISTNFHVQIRWSHGKFCGNPEGKLYKNFAWKALPFVDNLLN